MQNSLEERVNVWGKLKGEYARPDVSDRVGVGHGEWGGSRTTEQR